MALPENIIDLKQQYPREIAPLKIMPTKGEEVEKCAHVIKKKQK